MKLSAGVTAWRVEDVLAKMENQPIQFWIDRSTSDGGAPLLDDALSEKLVTALAAQLSLPIPFGIYLWDVAMIACLLKRDERQVRNRMACLSDFPKTIRLPVTSVPRLYRGNLSVLNSRSL